MRIYFHRYNSICEPGILDAFHKLGFEVYQETREILRKNIPSEERIEALATVLLTMKRAGAPFDCVFSVNFFPHIADVCSRLDTPYFALTVDCPVVEVFSKSISEPCCRVFLFDRKQYELVHAWSPNTVFHLPLGADPKLREGLSGLKSAGPEADPAASYEPVMAKKTRCVSLVGSLYNEKSRLQAVKHLLKDHTAGFIKALMDAQEEIYGLNFLMDCLSDAQIRELKTAALRAGNELWHELSQPICSREELDRYIAVHYYLDHELTFRNRVRILNALSEHFETRLYTASPLENTGLSPKVKAFGPVSTYRGMPNVFSHSAINLQPTLRSIEGGLSQRVFDVLICGGFLMMNYQEEAFEQFTPGKELAVYESVPDLLDKCACYLDNENEREAVARAGYEAAVSGHTWETRIKTMFSIL